MLIGGGGLRAETAPADVPTFGQGATKSFRQINAARCGDGMQGK